MGTRLGSATSFLGSSTMLNSIEGLSFLRAAYNRLNGTIPDTFATLTQLFELHLHHNQLSGPLPASFAVLKKLQFLTLSNNRLCGVVPSSWSAGLASLCNASSTCLYSSTSSIFRFSRSFLMVSKMVNGLYGSGLQLHHNYFPETIAAMVNSSNSTCGQCDTSVTSTSPSAAVDWLTFHSSNASALFPQLDSHGNTTAAVQTMHFPTTSSETLLGGVYSSQAAVMALIGPIAVLSSGFSGIPMLQQRLSSTLSQGGCAYTMSDFRVTDSPTPLVLGDRKPGGALRGAVLGNVLFVLGVVTLQMVYGVAVTLVRRPRRLVHAATVRNTLRAAALPGSWLVAVVLPLLQPTVTLSVALLQGCSGLPALTADVVIGVTGLLCAVAVLALLLIKLNPRGGASFGAVYRPARYKAKVQLSWWVELLVGGGDVFAWRSAKSSPQFVERYGALFVTTRLGWHWWATSEAMLSALVAVVTAASVGTGAEDAAAWATAAVQVAWAVLHCVWTPYRTLVDHVVAALLNTMCAVAALLDAAGGATGSVSLWLTVATICISVAGAVVPAVARVQLFVELLRGKVLRRSDVRRALPLTAWLVRCPVFHKSDRVIRSDEVQPVNLREALGGTSLPLNLNTHTHTSS